MWGLQSAVNQRLNAVLNSMLIVKLRLMIVTKRIMKNFRLILKTNLTARPDIVKEWEPEQEEVKDSKLKYRVKGSSECCEIPRI